MPDKFDPDAWPGGNTGSTPPDNGNGDSEPNPFTGAGSHARDDDDFDAFSFNDDADTSSSTFNDDDDDFGSFSYDFDEEPAVANPWGQQPQQSPVATSQRSAGGNDYYDDDDDDPYSNLYSDDDDRGRNNYDDDDDFDRFDDFDNREPEQGNNLKRTLIGIGAVAFFVVALGIGVNTLVNGDDKKVATPPTSAPAAPAAQQQPEQPPAAQPQQQAPPAAAPADEGTATPDANPPVALTRQLGEALKGWGQFAVNGDLEEVERFFVPTSSQYLHFKDVEAPALQAKPIGNPPYTMTMSPDDFKAIQSGKDWKISGTVTAKRAGERDQQFRWEFTMTQVNANAPWQISQVRQF